jgi:hypothetical protein
MAKVKNKGIKTQLTPEPYDIVYIYPTYPFQSWGSPEASKEEMKLETLGQ